MTTRTPSRSTSAAATIGLTMVVTLVWLVYALVRADTTVHLGPLIVPFVPVVTAYGASRIVATTGLATALAATVVALLAATGNLDGPALGPFGDAVIESVVVLAVAAPVALFVAALSRGNIR